MNMPLPRSVVPASAEAASHRRWTVGELQQALLAEQFQPFFQPKVDLITGRVTCAEMLARWNHPELGILPPGQFVEVMERNS